MSMPESNYEWKQLEAEEARLQAQLEADLEDPTLDAETISEWLASEIDYGNWHSSDDVLRLLERIRRDEVEAITVPADVLLVLLMWSQDPTTTQRIAGALRESFLQGHYLSQRATNPMAVNIMSAPLGGL